MRKISLLGMTVAALLATVALSVSAASAADFHSEAAHTIIDGAQQVAEDGVFTVNAGTIKCKSQSYSGTSESATVTSTTTVTLTSGCTAFGFVNAAVDSNYCHYTVTAHHVTHITNTTAGTACTTFTAFNCHVKIEPQTISSGITFDNSGSGSSRDITVTFNLTGIKYTQESKSFPGCSNGTFTNGTYKASATLTGTNTAGGQVGIWHA
jgi:hypothetical protein